MQIRHTLVTQGGKTVKRKTLFVILALLVGAAGLFADEYENESVLYPKSLQIKYIYPHTKGYRIDYIRQNYTMGVLWAPIEWFQGTANIGTITMGEGKAYPYVTFYYKDGEIDHFHLYLMENPAHESWGSLDPGVDYSGEFPSPDSKPVITY